MTDATESALLAAIRTAPDDDMPRLAYADWLDEHGEHDRAEFIRVQCELAKCGPCPATIYYPIAEAPRRHPHLRHVIEPGPKPKKPCGRCPVCALRGRERKLFAMASKYQVEWAGKAAHGLMTYGADWISYLPWFHRGFLNSVTCTVAEWCGGWCTRCDGDGERHGSDRTYPPTPCPVCNGKGRTPALGPLVVRDQMVCIMKVVLSDAKPWVEHIAWGGFRWQGEQDWAEVNADGGEPTSTIGGLPVGLVREMQPHPDFAAADQEETRIEGELFRTYPTRELALAAVSPAALAWAQKTDPIL